MSSFTNKVETWPSGCVYHLEHGDTDETALNLILVLIYVY